MTILIDVDGCRIVDITVKLADERNIDCVSLCDNFHVFEKVETKTIAVSKGSDRVDFVSLLNDRVEFC